MDGPPAFPEADEVHYPAARTGMLTLTAAPPEATLPSATVEFVLSNDHYLPFETNYYHWRIHRWAGGTWWYLGAFWPLTPAHTLLPYSSHEWTVTVDNDLVGTADEPLSPDATASVPLTGLGAGAYAFSAVGEFVESETRHAVVTPFELEGASVDLVPSPGVETTRDGDTVRVTDPETAGDRDHLFEATRRKDAEASRPLVPEWGLRQQGIRNTVPFLSEGVRSVVFATDEVPVYDRERVDGARFAHDDAVVEFGLRRA